MSQTNDFRLYRFSPVKDGKELIRAIQYVGQASTRLCRKITGSEYQISGLTIFAHYPDEFERLKALALDLGELIGENNGPYVSLRDTIRLPNNELGKLRIRQPDPYRMQVGCNDFDVGSYKEFKRRYLAGNVAGLRLFERPTYEMVELFDPDFDVLAYAVSTIVV